MHEFTAIRYEILDGTAWVTLNRPEVMNASTPALYSEVRAAIRLANLDAACDSIVLTGAGRAFGTGGDLNVVLEHLDSPDPLKIYEYGDSVPFDVVRNSPKVTIAAVNGKCMGGGLAIALCCDILVASESAVFSVPEARVGMADGWLPALLLGRVSLAHSRYLVLSGKQIDAAEADRIGLLTKLVPDDELMSTVGEVIDDLRTTDPAARTLYKEYINLLLPMGEAHLDRTCSVYMPNARDGLMAFINRK